MSANAVTDVLAWLEERGRNSLSHGSHADAYEIAARRLKEAITADRETAGQATIVGYRHLYAGPYGGWRFNNGEEVNGGRPLRSEPVYGAPLLPTEAAASAREALKYVEKALSPIESTPSRDPSYHDLVNALGDRIGFGALMKIAELCWREDLAANDFPVGGEFVAGPMRAQIDKALRLVRAALPHFPEGA